MSPVGCLQVFRFSVSHLPSLQNQRRLQPVTPGQIILSRYVQCPELEVRGTDHVVFFRAVSASREA